MMIRGIDYGCGFCSVSFTIFGEAICPRFRIVCVNDFLSLYSECSTRCEWHKRVEIQAWPRLTETSEQVFHREDTALFRVWRRSEGYSFGVEIKHGACRKSEVLSHGSLRTCGLRNQMSDLLRFAESEIRRRGKLFIVSLPYTTVPFSSFLEKSIPEYRKDLAPM